MKSGNAQSDRELSTQARRLGLQSSNCDTCGASGMRGPRVVPGDSHGAVLDMVCGDCEGSGRWWFPAIRPLGAFTAHLTDAQLLAWVPTGERQRAAHGN
jgi:hypothetical protein